MLAEFLEATAAKNTSREKKKIKTGDTSDKNKDGLINFDRKRASNKRSLYNRFCFLQGLQSRQNCLNCFNAKLNMW